MRTPEYFPFIDGYTLSVFFLLMSCLRRKWHIQGIFKYKRCIRMLLYITFGCKNKCCVLLFELSISRCLLRAILGNNNNNNNKNIIKRIREGVILWKRKNPNFYKILGGKFILKMNAKKPKDYSLTLKSQIYKIKRFLSIFFFFS